MHYFSDSQVGTEMMQPTYWQQYLAMLAEYHRKDAIKYRKDKKVFDDALAEVRKLCGDEERFLPYLTTSIVRAGNSSLPERGLTKGKRALRQ